MEPDQIKRLNEQHAQAIVRHLDAARRARSARDLELLVSLRSKRQSLEDVGRETSRLRVVRDTDQR